MKYNKDDYAVKLLLLIYKYFKCYKNMYKIHFKNINIVLLFCIHYAVVL